MKRLIVLSIAALPVLAGGGWFTVHLGQPEASLEAVGREAAFTVRVFGCAANAVRVKVFAPDGELRVTQIAMQAPGHTVAIERRAGVRQVRVVTENTSGRTETTLVALKPEGAGIDRGETARLNGGGIHTPRQAGLRASVPE